MRIVQIKGANGSGKTTIAKQLIAKSKHIAYLNDKGKHVATILKDLGWIIIGCYKPESKMGGCDNIQTVELMKRYISLCNVAFPGYDILFEGMMISTIKSTFYDYLLDMEKQDSNVHPYFVILDTTMEACIERIQARGTMKPNLQFDNIASKVASIKRHALTYDQKYVRWMRVDRIQTKDMLDRFLSLISW